MRFFLCTVAIFFSVKTLACSCGALPKLSQATIDQIDYIAHVRIAEILIDSADRGKRPNGVGYFKVRIETLRHYKGGSFMELLVAGGHDKLRYSTSCDFAMKEGQEWIVFANYNKGLPFIAPCSRTVRYKDTEGFRDWQNGTGLKELAFLDSVFRKEQPAQSFVQTSYTSFFANGTAEKIECYDSVANCGWVAYYFPNGKLYGRIEYNNGLLHGKTFWYNREGWLFATEEYSKGKKTGKAIYYVGRESIGQPRYIHVYDDEGRMVQSQEFNLDSIGWYLSVESFYDPASPKIKHIYYSSKGRVKEIFNRVKGKASGDSITFDENGKVIQTRTYGEARRGLQQ